MVDREAQRTGLAVAALGLRTAIDRDAPHHLSCCAMPTYEYKCPNGHAFEKFYPRMNDRRHVPCPTCGAIAERVISGAGLVFKGSGFYINDYKRAGEKRPAEGDAKPTAEPKPAADAKPRDSGKKKKDSGDK